MKYLILITILFIYGCENVRHSIGVSGKPLSRNFEEKCKVNYKIIFGKVRPKEDED